MIWAISKNVISSKYLYLSNPVQRRIHRLHRQLLEEHSLLFRQYQQLHLPKLAMRGFQFFESCKRINIIKLKIEKWKPALASAQDVPEINCEPTERTSSIFTFEILNYVHYLWIINFDNLTHSDNSLFSARKSEFWSRTVLAFIRRSRNRINQIITVWASLCPIKSSLNYSLSHFIVRLSDSDGNLDVIRYQTGC